MNLEEFIELKTFFDSTTILSLTIYGEQDGEYTLEIWDGQAYVISLNNLITSFHIGKKYKLQEGDAHTYVWKFNNNFVGEMLNF